MQILKKLNTTRSILYLGQFGALALMVSLLVFNTTIMDSARQRIHTIVYDHNEKIELIIAMRTAARERTVILQKMLILQDPIDAADLLQDFNNLGSNFLKSRNKLTSLELNKHERALHTEYMNLVQQNGALRHQVINLITQDKIEQARHLLLNEVIPIQDIIFEKMSAIINIQKQATNRALADGEVEYNQALTLIIFSGIATVLIIIFIVASITRHISRTENIITDQKERARTTLYSIGDAVITTDTDGHIEEINVAGKKLLDLKNIPYQGKKLEELVQLRTGASQDKPLNPIQETLQQNQNISAVSDTLLTTQSGHQHYIEFTSAPIVNKQGQSTGVVLVIKDVSENRKLMNELAFHARHDYLTGLVNRREVESILDYLITEYRRYKEDTAFLAFIDLDQFKIINDTCGHSAGDELLKLVASILSKEVRDSDIVARLGGDEFTVILKRCDEPEAIKTMERLRDRIQKIDFCWENKCFKTSASIGLVPINESVGTSQDLMSSADTACYVAKEEGRNRVHFHSNSDDKVNKRQDEMHWVHRIRDAIENDNFEMFFQRIKSLRDDEQYLHGEILLRLKDTDGKYITPYSFIPSAERYNLMPEVDRHVIHKTFSLLNEYRHYEHVANGLFSINLSAQSLCDDDFLDFIAGQLNHMIIQPKNICFEITETAVMANMSQAMVVIDTLKNRGFKFSLDDFGSGLSSFSYLKNLPVNHLKIDGAFVKNINSDHLDFVMVSCMNQIATTLGIKTIAEFVENTIIEETLTTIGINYGQGYGIHKPEPLMDILRKLATQNNNQKFA